MGDTHQPGDGRQPSQRAGGDGGWLISRRSVLAGGSLLALASVAGLDLAACTSSAAPYKALTDHERAVVEAATARLIPGPSDDPTEAGHPGAREAGVASYIDGLLGALHHHTPKVYAGGPFSNRAGAHHDDMAVFVQLDAAATAHWKARIAGFVAAYQAGVRQLDRLAGGDFAKAPPTTQDAALVKNPKVPHLPRGVAGFTDLLFQHAVEGCYSVPEYGGNRDRSGWKEIRFGGDRQPRGYSAAEVSQSSGPDPLQPAGIVAEALKLLTATAPGSPHNPVLVGPQRS